MADGVWNRLRRALRREKHDLDEVLADATSRGNEILEGKERGLTATPEERLASEQARTAEVDAEFDALKRRIEGT